MKPGKTCKVLKTQNNLENLDKSSEALTNVCVNTCECMFEDLVKKNKKNGRRPPKKMEDNLKKNKNERQPQKKIKKNKDDIKKKSVLDSSLDFLYSI